MGEYLAALGQGIDRRRLERSTIRAQTVGPKRIDDNQDDAFGRRISDLAAPAGGDGRDQENERERGAASHAASIEDWCE